MSKYNSLQIQLSAHADNKLQLLWKYKKVEE